jgi:hypothetical protein
MAAAAPGRANAPRGFLHALQTEQDQIEQGARFSKPAAGRLLADANRAAPASQAL